MDKALTGDRSATPLRGRYLVQNRLLTWALRSADGLLSVLPGPKEGGVEEPKRVLLSMSGHLGDVVIASAAIPQVRESWPYAEIGILVGSWARKVLEGHPDVSAVHLVDHWKLNRGEDGLGRKLRRYASMRAGALREIRARQYDVAIDLYPFFPNTIPLLRAAGIPRRIGYASGGFGPLLTKALEWTDERRHISDLQADLLEAAGVRRGVELSYSLPPLAGSAPAWLPEEFTVVHMGAGQSIKEWPVQHWRTVVETLVAEGRTVILTGSGPGQREAAAAVADGLGRVHNVCDRCSWEEFNAIVASAQMVLSVDSVTGHLASARGVPSLVLMSGMSRPEQWSPLGARVSLLTNSVPCAPCFRSRGCADMTCIRGLDVETVVERGLGQFAELGAPQENGQSGPSPRSDRPDVKAQTPVGKI